MLVDSGNVFLITDYTLGQLREDWLIDRFAGVIVVSKAQPDLEMMEVHHEMPLRKGYHC